MSILSLLLSLILHLPTPILLDNYSATSTSVSNIAPLPPSNLYTCIYWLLFRSITELFICDLLRPSDVEDAP